MAKISEIKGMLKAFKILNITVDIQLIELTEKPAHAKAQYWAHR